MKSMSHQVFDCQSCNVTCCSST